MSQTQLTNEEIQKIADMAHIGIPTEELASYADMNQILKFLEQINQVNTTDVEPMAHPLNLTQRLREDKVTEHAERALLQELAPDRVEAGVYLVPQVINGEE